MKTFIEENFSENSISESSEENEELNNKGFISKIIDFFNYKPIEDYSPTRIKKKYFKKTKKNKTVIFHRKYSIQEVIKVIKLS